MLKKFVTILGLRGHIGEGRKEYKAEARRGKYGNGSEVVR